MEIGAGLGSVVGRIWSVGLMGAGSATRFVVFFFFSSRRRHTRLTCDWSSDVCSSDLCSRPRQCGYGSTVDDPGGGFRCFAAPATGAAVWRLLSTITNCPLPDVAVERYVVRHNIRSVSQH